MSFIHYLLSNQDDDRLEYFLLTGDVGYFGYLGFLAKRAVGLGPTLKQNPFDSISDEENQATLIHPTALAEIENQFEGLNIPKITALNLAIENYSKWVPYLLRYQQHAINHHRNQSHTLYGSAIIYGNQATCNHTRILDLLITHKVDFELKDYLGRTAIHDMIGLKATVESVSRLIDLGANIHTANNNGATLLHTAVESGNSSMVQYLIEKGLDASLYDNNGNNALDYAIKHCSHNKKMLILLIRQLKASLNSDIFKEIIYKYHLIDELRFDGVLENRQGADTKMSAYLNFSSRHESVTRDRTKETIESSIQKLRTKPDKTQYTDNELISYYNEFKLYLKSSLCQNDMAEISKIPYGQGNFGVQMKKLNAQQRYALTQLQLNKICDRLECSSGEMSRSFKIRVGLIWKTLKDPNGWKLCKGLTDVGEVSSVLVQLRQEFLKGLVDIQFSYSKVSNNFSIDDDHPSCAAGTVNFVIAMFSELHNDILVTDMIEYVDVFTSSIGKELSNNNYEILKNIIIDAYNEKFSELEEGLSSGWITDGEEGTYSRFFKGTLTLSDEYDLIHKAMQNFLGAVKKSFNNFYQAQPRLFSALQNSIGPIQYIEFENVLKVFPFELMSQALYQGRIQMTLKQIQNNQVSLLDNKPHDLERNTSLICMSKQIGIYDPSWFNAAPDKKLDLLVLYMAKKQSILSPGSGNEEGPDGSQSLRLV